MKPPIETVWRRIRQHAGEPFSTITAVRFIYRVEGQTIIVDRTGYGIAKSNFERALYLIPVSSPGEFSHAIRGPAYVWAILHDKRIRQTDW